MLKLDHLCAGYAAGQVLFDLSLSVAEGEAVALLGRNGMGKTTTIRAIMGMLRVTAGEISFYGQHLQHAPAHHAARAGIGLVPEGRRIFANLTVEENLLATAATRHGARWTLPAIYRLLPRLRERRRQRGTLLSGGEQQMLAIGRALMTNPRLLILDEATEGLAPLIRDEIYTILRRLHAEGESLIVVDKHLSALMTIADRVAIISKGQVVWQGPPTAALATSPWLAI